MSKQDKAREFWVRNGNLNKVDSKRWKDEIDYYLSRPSWVGTAITSSENSGSRDGIKVIEIFAYDELQHKIIELKEEIGMLKSANNKNINLAMALSNMQKEKLAIAVEALDKIIDLDGIMGCETVDLAKEALARIGK